MKNGFYKAMVGVAIIVLSTISLAPVLLHVDIPQAIWGMSLGALAGIANTLVPSGEERYELKVPAEAKARMTIEIQE